MMTASEWRWDPERLASELEQRGWDIELSDARLLEGGGSLSARRDRGGRALLLAVDAGGRVQASLTTVIEQRGETLGIGDVRLRLVRETQRRSTLSGTLTEVGQFWELLRLLDTLDSGRQAGAIPGPIADR
jgi:hypothetical protein